MFRRYISPGRTRAAGIDPDMVGFLMDRYGRNGNLECEASYSHVDWIILVPFRQWISCAFFQAVCWHLNRNPIRG